MLSCQSSMELNIENVFEAITSKQIQLNVKCIIFGVDKGTFDISIDQLSLCNFLIVTTKWILWKHRNKVRYNAMQKENSAHLVRNAMLYAKRNIDLILRSFRKDILTTDLICMLELIRDYHIT